MKRVIVSMAVLVASAVCVMGADRETQEPKKELKITSKVKQEAATAFAKGMSYYIWYVGPVPLKTANTDLRAPQLWLMRFAYIAKKAGDAVPFRAVAVLPYKDPQSGAAGEVRRGAMCPGFEKNSIGEETATFTCLDNKTEGKAEAKMYLIKEPGTPPDQNEGEPISNTVTIPLLAPTAKPAGKAR